MTSLSVHLTAPVGPEDSPLVVLAHSLGTGPLIWDQVVPGLSMEYRVSLLTLPGHGDAPVPTHPFSMNDLTDAVADRISALPAEETLFAGVSIGGALALSLGLRHPNLLTGIVSIASAPSLGGPDHWAERAALVRQQSTSALVTSSASTWFAPDTMTREPDLAGRTLRQLQETSDEGYALCAEALGTYDLHDQLPQILSPVLAIGGEHDLIAPQAQQELIAQGVHRGRFVMIANAAHQPPVDQASQVLGELLNFFREVTQ